MIKIAFIISNLGQGGAERQFVELLKGLRKDLFQIDVILYAYQKEAFYKEIFDVEHVTIVTRKLENKSTITKTASSILFLFRTIKKQNYDLIYTSLFHNSFLVRLATFPQRSHKVIVSVRNNPNSYKRWYLRWEKLFFDRSTIVFNSSAALKSYGLLINKPGLDNCHLIYNGYNSPTQGVTENKENSIIVGGLGRRSSQKNFHQLIRIFPQLKSPENQSLALILQGSEGDQSSLIQAEIERLNLTEDILVRKESTDIEMFFREIDIFVLPSLYEGCPNVLFEALLRKKICIISQFANSDDFIIDGHNGLVYDGTDEHLVQKINEGISILNTQAAKQIINNGYEYAKQEFSMASMVDKYESLFISTYEKNKSRS